MYPLRMMDIPDQPFDKIAIDLITGMNVSTSGNQHIINIIDHLKGWLEAFPNPDNKVNTIVHVFINNYLPDYMCLRYVLCNNGTEFNNQLMDKVFQQLGIGHIFSIPYHPQRNWKLEVFCKYLKPHTQESVWEWPGQLGPMHELGACHLSHKTTPPHRWKTLLPHLWQRPYSFTTPNTRTHAVTSWWPRFWMPTFGSAPFYTNCSQENIGQNSLKW